jgi:hypothetical protein
VKRKYSNWATHPDIDKYEWEAYYPKDYKRWRTTVTCPECGSKRVVDKNTALVSLSRYGYWTGRCKSCSMSGKNNYSWKGGRTVSGAGYVRVRVGDKYVLEHRLVMEKHLGRKLKSWEVVHHKNHNKQDNRIENLILVKKHQHDTITLLEIENAKLRKQIKELKKELIDTAVALPDQLRI